jgi:rRNA maturation protein Rpf1
MDLFCWEFDSNGWRNLAQELKFVFPNAERINRGGQVSELIC